MGGAFPGAWATTVIMGWGSGEPPKAIEPPITPHRQFRLLTPSPGFPQNSWETVVWFPLWPPLGVPPPPDSPQAGSVR